MESAKDKTENPRTSRVRRVVLDAAVELLLHEGATCVTAARISEETGVARTTIYRQWPDHASLVLATIEALVTPGRPQSPGTGDLATDLTSSLTNLRLRLVKRSVLPVFAALLEWSSRDDAFVEAQQKFVHALLRPTIGVLEEAQESGVLSKDLDCVTAAGTLASPLLFRHLIAREVIDDQLIEFTVSQFMGSQVD